LPIFSNASMLGPRKSLVVTSKASVKPGDGEHVGDIDVIDVNPGIDAPRDVTVDAPAPAAPDVDVADRIAQEVVRLLRIVSRMRHQNDIAVAHVLAELLDKGPKRVGEIAQSLGTDPSTVSRQVTALVEAGLVERHAHPDDGRAHLLAPTAAGMQRCAVGRRRQHELITTILSGWSAEDSTRLATLLGMFADDMQAAHEGERRNVRRSGGES
jgi:DNA-binding MarR family transcriptional regulator